MTTSWRVFCAVGLPEEVRTQLRDHIRRLREEIPDAAASWACVENIHLTLEFFGNVTLDRIPAISAATTRAAHEFSMFQIGVAETGVFPKPSQPQVLWIGVSDTSGQLSALQQRLEDECAAEGFPREDRPYRPHLTIARIRKPDGAKRLADAHLRMPFKPAVFEVKELVVFRSELSSKGSRYTSISRHPLAEP